MYVFQRWKLSLKLIFKVKILKSILTCFSVSVFFSFFSFSLLLEHIFWASSWVEEWVVLYDDSTMAWFTVSYSKYSLTPFSSIKLHPFRHIDGMCVYRHSLHIPKVQTEQRAFCCLLLLLLLLNM